MVKADDIILFAKVVEIGSFSRVAEQLELTNSVVSKRIGRLEQALNTQLLYRTTRKLNLTDAGKALYGKARLAKLACQDAEDAVTGYADAIKGRIKISLPDVSGRLVLSQAIAQFCQEYPDVEVELAIENRFVDLIEEGFDLAIRTAYLEDSSFIARRLIDSDWIVCASPEYLRLSGTPQEPEELADHHCLIYKYEGAGPDHWKFKRDGREYLIQVHGRFHTNNLDALRQAALTNFGVAFLPRALVHEDLMSGALVAVLSEHSAKYMGIYAVYPRTRQPDQKLRLLVEHMRLAFMQKKEYFY